jgi:hypothetical protein
VVGELERRDRVEADEGLCGRERSIGKELRSKGETVNEMGTWIWIGRSVRTGKSA